MRFTLSYISSSKRDRGELSDSERPELGIEPSLCADHGARRAVSAYRPIPGSGCLVLPPSTLQASGALGLIWKAWCPAWEWWGAPWAVARCV